MSNQLLKASPIGRIVAIGNDAEAYVPGPLPRGLDLNGPLVKRLDEASRSVSMLAGVGETIPNPNSLIRPFMRREAVLSSSIEGTQASISDLFIYEASGIRRRDVVEVSNYTRALDSGLDLLDTLPISLRLVNRVHERLLAGVRGDEKRPGELRNAQVWIGHEGVDIGDARFVPPPPHMLSELLLDWERFVNEESELPPLVQCALMHYQFEAIHPYLDGNGRVGRLLIILFLCAKSVLSAPLLYLSAYFEKDKNQYYDQLLGLSQTGEWNVWLDYFLKGVAEQSQDALDRVRRMRQLQDRYRLDFHGRRASANTLRLGDQLFASPYVTGPWAAKVLNVSQTGARRIIDSLVSYGVLEEIEGTWPRVYVAREILEAIE